MEVVGLHARRRLPNDATTQQASRLVDPPAVAGITADNTPFSAFLPAARQVGPPCFARFALRAAPTRATRSEPDRKARSAARPDRRFPGAAVRRSEAIART